MVEVDVVTDAVSQADSSSSSDDQGEVKEGGGTREVGRCIGCAVRGRGVIGRGLDDLERIRDIEAGGGIACSGERTK